MKPVDLLAVMAHPDDAELLCGGALARAARLGRRVGILDLTRGEAGSSGDAETRTREAARAARILGVAERANAGLSDGALANSQDARTTVAAFIRRLRPDTVITHWREARHPDHRAAGALARDACFLAGLKLPASDAPPHRPRKLIYALSYQEDAPKPTFVVDITETIDAKLDAIFAFGTQFEGRTAMGDVFGGGQRPLRDQILAHMAHYGSLIRRPYAEPFWTRETMLVDDVAGVAINSL